MKKIDQTQILVIGGGVSGLSTALHLADFYKVTIVVKGLLNDCATYYAQGGIATVFDTKDSFDYHIQDTLVAGAGICDEKVVKFTIENGTKVIKWLIKQGVEFDKQDLTQDAKFHLTQEGGHSCRRIFHVADATGKSIQNILQKKVLEHPNISILENHTAIDLITSKPLQQRGKDIVLGAYLLDKEQGTVITIQANFVVLATGGFSKVYQYTSNPDVLSGDGIAMAWRAGCSVVNMEFNQFHPTCLYHEKARNFLLSEALRGEGGVLIHADGTRFMPKYDSRAELAPRDIVARSIDQEIKNLGIECVFLDIRHKGRAFILKHFPTIYQKCLDLGIDITQNPIPVVPAAHYSCGGVKTNLDGLTDIINLYAIGEVSYTGLHGANRLASNSLLECLVFADAAASNIRQVFTKVDQSYNRSTPKWDDLAVRINGDKIDIAHKHQTLRALMWDFVGIIRTDKKLEKAMGMIKALKDEINESYSKVKICNELLELRNLVLVAELIVRCALQRKESRGLHCTLNYPLLNKEGLPTTLISDYIDLR